MVDVVLWRYAWCTVNASDVLSMAFSSRPGSIISDTIQVLLSSVVSFSLDLRLGI